MFHEKLITEMAMGQMALKVRVPSENTKLKKTKTNKPSFLYPNDFRDVQNRIHAVHSGSKVSLNSSFRQLLSGVIVYGPDNYQGCRLTHTNSYLSVHVPLYSKNLLFIREISTIYG